MSCHWIYGVGHRAQTHSTLKPLDEVSFRIVMRMTHLSCCVTVNWYPLDWEVCSSHDPSSTLGGHLQPLVHATSAQQLISQAGNAPNWKMGIYAINIFYSYKWVRTEHGRWISHALHAEKPHLPFPSIRSFWGGWWSEQHADLRPGFQ